MGIFSRILNRRYRPTQPKVSRRFFPQSNNLYVDDEVAMTVAAFNRGVLYLASTLAKLPWEVKQADNSLIKNSDISKLLNRNPNEETTAYHLRLTNAIEAIVTGNGYWEIERDRVGRAKKLWHIPSRDVCPQRDENGRLWYKITGQSAAGVNNGILYMRPSEVFHTRNLHVKDSLMGLGVTEYAAQSIGVSHGADRFANSLFANGGLPSASLSVEGTLNEEAVKRIKEGWQENMGGRKTGSLAVLEQGAKLEPIQFAPDVLQFIETRKFGVPEIARFLGVPPTKLYDLAQSTYNNIEQENLAVANDTFDPWAKGLEAEANKKLLGDDLTRKTELDLYEVFRGDMDTRSQYYNRMMQTGSMSPNEIRRREGMAPYEGGERYYIAVNNFTPADRVDEVIDSQVKEPETQEVENEEPTETEQAIVNYLNQTRS